MREENIELKEEMAKLRKQMERIQNQYTEEEMEEVSEKRKLRNSIQKLPEEMNTMQIEVENLHKTKTAMKARQQGNMQGNPALIKCRTGKTEARKEIRRETDTRRTSMEYDRMQATVHQNQESKDRKEERRSDNRIGTERREENIHSDDRDRISSYWDRRDYRNTRYRMEYPRRTREITPEDHRIRNNYRNNRNLRMEAITISRQDKESYADILRKVKQNINLREIGIKETRIKRTATGNLLIQIEGKNCKEKADLLAEKKKGIVGEEARINRPTRRAELRVSGLDEDTGPEEVASRIIKETGCEREEIIIGNIRRNRFGVGNI